MKKSPASNKHRRFQIYRQGPAGNYSPRLGTNSAIKAVEAFLTERPAFEGGDMHLWNHHEHRVCASVKWNVLRTPSGTLMRHRTNVFCDALLAFIVRQIHGRETAGGPIHHRIRVSA
jgi:hypothetical protein